jgi:hypothetical protein
MKRTSKRAEFPRAFARLNAGLLPEIVASSLFLARAHSAGHATSSGRLIPIGCAPQIGEQGKEKYG